MRIILRWLTIGWLAISVAPPTATLEISKRLPPCLTCSRGWSQFLLTEEFLLLPSNSTSPSAIGIHTKSPIPLIHSFDLPPDILCARNHDFLTWSPLTSDPGGL